MQVGVLGPLQVQAAGRLLALGGVKQRAVLAMLALQVNRVVSMDQLVAGLWAVPPETAVVAVQVYLSRLRKTLQAEDRPGDPAAVLVRRRPGYCWS